MIFEPTNSKLTNRSHIATLIAAKPLFHFAKRGSYSKHQVLSLRKFIQVLGAQPISGRDMMANVSANGSGETTESLKAKNKSKMPSPTETHTDIDSVGELRTPALKMRDLGWRHGKPIPSYEFDP